MAPASVQHRRTHNLLLVNNLLNCSGSTSPFTLIFDTLEQSGKSILTEVTANAKSQKFSVIYISFETLHKPANVDAFIPTWETAEWYEQVLLATQSHQKDNKSKSLPCEDTLTFADTHIESLLIIDSLNLICSTKPDYAPTLLASLISPSVSLFGLYHRDVPSTTFSPTYTPQIVDMLSYLATTIFTAHSLHHVLARKAARDRSIVEPSFGLAEGEAGILQGLGANIDKSIVLEMEHRRKSGRGVREWYILDTKQGTKSSVRISLLEDHPGYQPKIDTPSTDGEAVSHPTFELGLTDRQRRDREGVVLPYFDAQKGNDEGGRILYDMGSEDDFDEEEDEI